MNEEVLSRLRDIQGFVIDLDGTLALGNKHNEGLIAIPGAVEWLHYLNRKELPFVIFTNGTLRRPQEYIPKLTAIGLPVNESLIMTPSSVAADYFSRQRYQRIMTMGGEGVWGPLKDAGLDVVFSSSGDFEGVDAVYAGWYREFGMQDIETAFQAIDHGAKLYSASGTPFFATATGKALGTSVILTGALTAVTGQQARVIGKPSIEAAHCAASRLGLPVSRVAVIGDDPHNEVSMAHGSGSMAIFINGGAGACEVAPGEQPPHLDLTSVDELLQIHRTL